jgi:hypothetical protein
MAQVTVTVPAKTVTVRNVSVDVPATTVTAQVPVPAQTITQDIVVTVPAYDIVVDVPDPTPTPPPKTTVPYVASIDHGGGRPAAADLFDQYVKNGYNGWVEYQTPSTPTRISGTMTTIKARHGSERIAMQQTCRTHSDAGLAQVLDWLPDSWRDDYLYNYFQEPEDNLAGNAAGQKAYRDTVTAAAKVIKTFNQANPGRKVSWPALELAEYSLLLKYVNGDLSRDPELFKPPDSDFSGVLWSLFEYGEKGKDSARLQAQIDRIVRCMNETFPGKWWGTMAGGYTLEPVVGDNTSVYGYTAAQKQAQAWWLTEMANRCIAAGAKQVGWYNVKFPGTGGPAGELRVEVIPETLAAFKALPR